VSEGRTNDSEAERAPSRRAFLLRRLHSLSGVLPVGVFLVVHLWTNASALGGREPFDHAVDEIQKLPVLPLVEVGGVLLPLAFHAIFGVYLATQGRPNVGRYSYGRNWSYVFQRITGAIAFVFILAHLWELRIQKWLFGLSHHAFYDTLASHLGSVKFGAPWMALFYLVGIGASVFHLANGLVTSTLTWGIVTTRGAQRRLTWVVASLGVVLFLLGASTVLSLSTGTTVSTASAPKATCP
jgi:succinate dehydrogenase / fumarate reductase, cytochrome b subunit